MLLLLDQVWHSTWRLMRRRFGFPDLLFVSIMLLFLMLQFFGRTLGEVARLWIFMIPMVSLAAGHVVARRFPARRKEMLVLLIALQMIITLHIRKYQDFW